MNRARSRRASPHRGAPDAVWNARIIQHARRWGKWILVAAVAAGAVHWLRSRPVPVEGYPVAQGDIAAEVMGTGTLEARVQTVVSTKIPGRILDMRVDQGDAVSAGQALLRLDDSEFRQQVEMARSALEAAKATKTGRRSSKPAKVWWWPRIRSTTTWRGSGTP